MDYFIHIMWVIAILLLTLFIIVILYKLIKQKANELYEEKTPIPGYYGLVALILKFFGILISASIVIIGIVLILEKLTP